ncbi:MAG: preprotein translocase subunit SecG [Elusimicrobiota bacterium]
MYNLFLILHIIICFLLIVSVLFFQTSKGSALSMFGGGGGDSLFSSPSGTSFIKKFTMWVALAFAINSIILTMLSPTRYKSVLNEAPPPPVQTKK